MKQKSAIQSYTRFYDQVLNEVSYGRVEQGINILVGMLDATDQQTQRLDQAKAELQSHLLYSLLLEDPLCAYAVAKPGDTVGLATIIADGAACKPTSSTSLKLFAATRSQPIARALLGRHVSIARLMKRAASDGRTVLACSDVHPSSKGTYDLICAAELADRAEGPALAETLEKFRAILAESGRIVLPAALPGHLGTGWRKACLNWNPCTHDEQSLARAAATAGFSARIYRDETDCLVWAELQPK